MREDRFFLYRNLCVNIVFLSPLNKIMCMLSLQAIHAFNRVLFWCLFLLLLPTSKKTPKLPSCRGMCKIVNWSDHHFSLKSNIHLYKIWNWELISIPQTWPSGHLWRAMVSQPSEDNKHKINLSWAHKQFATVHMLSYHLIRPTLNMSANRSWRHQQKLIGVSETPSWRVKIVVLQHHLWVHFVV